MSRKNQKHRKKKKVFPWKRMCPSCEQTIVVGPMKVGRVVWDGGVCYDCHRRAHPEKFK